MRRHLAAFMMSAFFCNLAAADTSAPVAAAPSKLRHWLTARDGLPAAATSAGVIASPEEKACRWVTVGSKWTVLDLTGAVVGETRVKRLESSEPWPCKMAALRHMPSSGRILLEADAPPPQRTRLWSPAAAERSAFSSLLRLRSDTHVLFFETAAGRFGVGALSRSSKAIIARLDGTVWHEEWNSTARVLPEHQNQHLRYLDPAAIDLDGDGASEVVLGWYEAADYGDLILHRDRNGTWHPAASSFEGNTM